MTRLTKLYTAVLMLLMISISNNVFASVEEGDRTSRTNWVNSMGHPEEELCIMILPDNILRIHVYLGVGTPNIEEFAPLKVQYNWGGYISGVTNSVKNSDLVPVDINGYEGYEAKFIFTINLNDMCSGPNPPSNPSDFDFTYSLVTPNGTGGFDLYPVVTTPDVYPLYMFPEVGKPGYTPSHTGQKSLCCLSEPNTGGFVQSPNQPDANQSKGRVIIGDAGSSQDLNNAPFDSEFIEPSLAEYINIFPNPADQLLNVEFAIPESDYFQIDILNVNGERFKSIYRKTDDVEKHNIELDISDLSKGIYFCRVISATQSQSLKFIKL